MDEVYTCICRGKTWVIHEGFIRCVHCRKEYDFKRIRDLSGKERIDLQCVADFNKRVEQVEKDIKDDSKTEGGR